MCSGFLDAIYDFADDMYDFADEIYKFANVTYEKSIFSHAYRKI